jgi:hypothetical protein
MFLAKVRFDNWRKNRLKRLNFFETFAICSGVLNILKKLAQSCIILCGDWPWPPRSPDLAICDFFLWGYLRQQIWNVPHEQQPRNLRQLRQAVILACQSLDAQMIQSAFSGMVNRARRCIGYQGHAFSDE